MSAAPKPVPTALPGERRLQGEPPVLVECTGVIWNNDCWDYSWQPVALPEGEHIWVLTTRDLVDVINDWLVNRLPVRVRQ